MGGSDASGPPGRFLPWGGTTVEGHETGKLGRRALLAAGAAGAAAAVAQAVAPARVLAANGDPLKLGQTNDATATTVVVTTGAAAFRGQSDVGEGLVGQSNEKSGVVGTSGSTSGVYGDTTNAEAEGVTGKNPSVGTAGALGTREHGAMGAHEAGRTFGALAGPSAALFGQAPLDVDHHGLFVVGRAHFGTSGRLTIAANRSSVSATAPALTVTSMVLATLQTNHAGVYVQAALANPASGKITVYLNRKVPAATKVAYFILD